MNRSQVTLGKAAQVAAGSGMLVKTEVLGIEDRMRILEEKMEMVLKMLAVNGIADRKAEEDQNDTKADVNSDGIPIGIHMLGTTKGEVFVLAVNEDAYYVGHKPYKSLSAAASDVRGTRVSGWSFWRLPDGRTAKEAFLQRPLKEQDG